MDKISCKMDSNFLRYIMLFHRGSTRDFQKSSAKVGLTDLKSAWKIILIKVLEILSTRQIFVRLSVFLSCVQWPAWSQKRDHRNQCVKLWQGRKSTQASLQEIPCSFTFRPYASYSDHFWSNLSPKVMHPHNLRYAPSMLFNFEEWKSSESTWKIHYWFFQKKNLFRGNRSCWVRKWHTIIASSPPLGLFFILRNERVQEIWQNYINGFS